MRQFTTLFTLSLLLFGGCSSSERFTPTSTYEKASISYKNVRLLDNGKSEIILSTVYLNEVYPKYAGNFAHFLVSFYATKGSALYFDKEKKRTADDYLLTLNGESALQTEELERDDLLLELMPVSNRWSRYYYVRYRLPSANAVLVLESDHSTKAVVTYQKARQ